MRLPICLTATLLLVAGCSDAGPVVAQTQDEGPGPVVTDLADNRAFLSVEAGLMRVDPARELSDSNPAVVEPRSAGPSNAVELAGGELVWTRDGQLYGTRLRANADHRPQRLSTLSNVKGISPLAGTDGWMLVHVDGQGLVPVRFDDGPSPPRLTGVVIEDLIAEIDGAGHVRSFLSVEREEEQQRLVERGPDLARVRVLATLRLDSRPQWIAGADGQGYRIVEPSSQTACVYRDEDHELATCLLALSDANVTRAATHAGDFTFVADGPQVWRLAGSATVELITTLDADAWPYRIDASVAAGTLILSTGPKLFVVPVDSRNASAVELPVQDTQAQFVAASRGRLYYNQFSRGIPTTPFDGFYSLAASDSRADGGNGRRMENALWIGTSCDPEMEADCDHPDLIAAINVANGLVIERHNPQSGASTQLGQIDGAWLDRLILSGSGRYRLLEAVVQDRDGAGAHKAVFDLDLSRPESLRAIHDRDGVGAFAVVPASL